MPMSAPAMVPGDAERRYPRKARDMYVEDRGTIVDRWEPSEDSAGGVNGPRVVEIRLVIDDADGNPAEFATSVLIPMGGRRG